MEDVKLNLPPDIVGWIESRVGRGGFASADEYVADLVERDRRNHTHGQLTIDDLRQMVDESRKSGVSKRTTREIFEEAVAISKARGTYRE